MADYYDDYEVQLQRDRRPRIARTSSRTTKTITSTPTLAQLHRPGTPQNGRSTATRCSCHLPEQPTTRPPSARVDEHERGTSARASRRASTRESERRATSNKAQQQKKKRRTSTHTQRPTLRSEKTKNHQKSKCAPETYSNIRVRVGLFGWFCSLSSSLFSCPPAARCSLLGMYRSFGGSWLVACGLAGAC